VNCAAVRDVLPEFALGVAPSDDASAVELHVETCAACRKEAVDMQRAAASFGYALAGDGVPPETLEHTVVDAVHEVARPAKHTRARGRRTGIALLVAAVLVASVGIGSVIAGREEHLRLQAERTATAQNDSFQSFANITQALSGRDTKVLIGTLSASSGPGTGSALTILTKDAEDQVVVVVNDLSGRALPLDVSISNTKGRTIDVGSIHALDNAGGATMAREVQSSLSGFIDVTIRDAHGKVVLRGTLQAQTAVASPPP
jgi:predicted anti-sigma-YlaC factor YlaD